MRFRIFNHHQLSTAAVVAFSLTFSSLFAAGTMRDISSMKVVEEMKIGWNLGNTLDATGGSGLNTETSWGNPKTTKAMMDELKNKGFKTIRIPVTWEKHFGSAPDYAIDRAWLDRVQEVVDYVIDNGMYAILNTHHDEWVVLKSGSQNEVTDKITKIWKQIAERFKDYSDYLIFETLNEPRLYGEQTEWTGGTHEARLILNSYNIAIVKTIRETGGNNALRHIMIPTHAATAMEAAQDDLQLPEGDNRIIISQHTYWPYPFTMEEPGVNTWGSQKDKDECDDELDRIYEKFCSKGIPVVVGEWGAIQKNNTAARTVHAEYYAGAVRKRGMCPVWWDNGWEGDGGFALLNRDRGGWYFPEIVDGLIKGSDVPVAVSQPRQQFNIVTPSALDANASSTHYWTVFDISGRVLYRGNGAALLNAGNSMLPQSLRNLRSGSYIFRITNGTGTVERSVTVAR